MDVIYPVGAFLCTVPVMLPAPHHTTLLHYTTYRQFERNSGRGRWSGVFAFQNAVLLYSQYSTALACVENPNLPLSCRRCSAIKITEPP